VLSKFRVFVMKIFYKILFLGICDFIFAGHEYKLLKFSGQ